MPEIAMPRLSDSMTEGTILAWLRDDGDELAIGDELVEIETDKAAMTYESELAGVLRIAAAVGETLPVGAVIAHVGDGAAPEPAREPASESPIGSSAVRIAVAAGVAVPAAPAAGHGRVLATPLARRTAALHGAALEDVAGSGPSGRVTRADVLAALGLAPPASAPVAPAAAPAAPAAAPPPPADADRVEPTRLQRLIARRMAETNATVPEFEVQTEVVMDAAIALRAKLKELGHEARPVPTFNDLVLRACAIALRRHPRVNATYRDDGFYEHPRVSVGFAVASEDALVVPVVADADGLSLGAIAAETRRLAAAVRDGTIAPRELEGGTFTVSNLGMLGMTAIRPIIHAGQAAILGVGAMRPTLARVDGEIADRTLMTITLSADHRILYGADASRFLAEVRDLLEAPIAAAL